MKTEIKIILEDGVSNKVKGNCFENLVRDLLSTHHYEIRGNVNFSGMEIDLIANHKHKSETLYVECKAKERVSSDELSKFCFNVDFKEVDSGYFFRTQELEFQAGALLIEIKNKPKYKNLSFFEPNDIITMLSDSRMISEPISNLNNYSISKKILAITYLGDYLIYLVKKSNSYPTEFIVVNAKNNNESITTAIIDKLVEKIDDLKTLNLIPNIIKPNELVKRVKSDLSIETISEVQESENWFDFLPASSRKKHFVGRDVIRTQILEYFKEIQTTKSLKRVFYLNGKSGWGKSSLLLEIKNRCRNKHYKNKFFTIAIDTRSAISDNFVALSLEKLINLAFDNNFIDKSKIKGNIHFTSSVDLLTSDFIVSLNLKLKEENKFLILIFDQFEDVFRKSDLFKSFYKFLCDVTDKKPNIIVGFSWKSDFFIPNDEPAYFYWQQAKEQAREFIINEFGEKEIDGIIKQLEQSSGKLDKGIKNRIKESSQGLPWLTKKLCKHIYEQIELGIKKEKLIESNLNIKELFEKDEERIEPEELRALKLIAQKAFDGDFFEISEVGETIESKTIESLLHKRLIIKSGVNYNIYWDIFRDYLVTNKIPPIGESYLLRQGVNLCLEVFLLFQNQNETIHSLLEKHPKKIGFTTLENILIELRNFGLIEKNEDYYKIAKPNIEVSSEGFKHFITEKFTNYTPYIVLKKLNLNSITKDDITKVLKGIFKQKYQDKTWESYSLYLISWFLFSEIDIKSKIVEPKKGRGRSSKISTQSNNIVPRNSIKSVIKMIKDSQLSSNNIKSKYYRDLLLLGLIDENRVLTDFGKTLLNKSDSEIEIVLSSKVLKIPKMILIKNHLLKNPKMTAKQLIDILPIDFFEGKAMSSKLIYASVAMTWVK